MSEVEAPEQIWQAAILLVDTAPLCHCAGKQYIDPVALVQRMNEALEVARTEKAERAAKIIVAELSAAQPNADSEVRAVLESLGRDAVRVCEEGGPEDIYASLAVSVRKLQQRAAAQSVGEDGRLPINLYFCPGSEGLTDEKDTAAAVPAAPVGEKCVKCGHNEVGLSGYCIKNLPDAYGNVAGGSLCGCKCQFAAQPAAVPSEGERQTTQESE